MNEKRESARPAALYGAASADRYGEALNHFVLLWGEMASSWGINRTMAQIHAVLYASEEPLDTDTIMERLQVSRGNANMNLRSLMSWNLVRKVHREGSRKDFYAAEKDVWDISAQIIQERQRREIGPVKHQLETCCALLTGAGAQCESGPDLSEREQILLDRLENLIELMDIYEGLSKTLLPLIQQRNRPMLKRLIAFATSLRDTKND